jgi:hypothetical protein
MDEKTTGAAPGRLPYHAPVLRDHGTIDQLTLTTPSDGDAFDNVTYAHTDATTIS